MPGQLGIFPTAFAPFRLSLQDRLGIRPFCSRFLSIGKGHALIGPNEQYYVDFDCLKQP